MTKRYRFIRNIVITSAVVLLLGIFFPPIKTYAQDFESFQPIAGKYDIDNPATSFQKTERNWETDLDGMLKDHEFYKYEGSHIQHCGFENNQASDEGGALAPHKKKCPSEENSKTIKRDDNLNSGPVPVWDK